jgi:hypothetical protein
VTGKTKPVSFQAKEENNYTMSKLSQGKKYTRYPPQIERLHKLEVLRQHQVSKEALPSIDVLNKNKTVCFLAIFGK